MVTIRRVASVFIFISICILLTLFLILQAKAGGLMMSSGTVDAGGACVSRSGADMANEGFEGTGFEDTGASWTETGTGNEDFDITGYTPVPTNGCDQGYQVVVGSQSTIMYDDSSTPDDTSSFAMDFYVTTIPTAWERIALLNTGESTTVGSVKGPYVYYYNEGGTHNVYVSGGDSGSESVITTISTNTWYSLEMRATATTAYAMIDGANLTSVGRGSYGMDYKFFGAGSYAQSGQYTFDNAQIDSDGDTWLLNP